MARFLPYYSLILMAALVIVASEATSVQPPASSPSPSSNNLRKPHPHLIRKHGKHHGKAVNAPAVSPSLSPSEAPVTQEKQSSTHNEDIAPPGQMEDLHVANPRHHRAFDRSMAGGGVILGGLGTTFFIAVMCYIRATRRTAVAKEAAATPAADQV